MLAFCSLLGLGLVVMAWRRARQRHRGLRTLAGAVAAGALWFTAFPPARPLPVASGEAILLTDGYQADTLRQLRRRLGAGTPLWYYGSAATPANARLLSSLLTLAEQRPQLRRLHVLGRGLPAAQLSSLGSTTVQQHSAPALGGFQTALWDRQVPLGQPFRIEGSVTLPNTRQPAWVYLRAAGTLRDSAQLPKDSRAFQLRYVPKAAGRMRYELLLRQAGQVVAVEPVPVEITSPELPAVLLLTATPSFEFKFLKNYLAEAHYPVALRTTVSRGLVQTDFVNQPTLSLSRLTPALLARYALLVADAGTLANLTGAESQALQSAISGGRLGLVVVADAAPLPRATPARAYFTIQPRAAAQAVPQALTWPDAPAEVKAALPAQVRPAPLQQALITGPSGAVAAASRRAGLGFVVVSVVPETFQWGLQGQSAAYASFWNRLLTAAVPPAPVAASWRVAPQWPRPHRPLTLHLAAGLPTAQPTVSRLGGGPSIRLALRQDTRLPEWSTAQFWAGEAGWHQVRGPGQATHSFYVYPDSAWQGPELQERQEALRLRSSTPQSAGASPKETVEVPWPAAWFFALFVLAAGYLWLEEKL